MGLLCAARAELLHVLLQRLVCLLGCGKVSSLEFLAKLVEELADWARASCFGVAALAVVVMMEMALGSLAAFCGCALEVLLEGGVVLLGSGKVARL